MPVKPKIGVFPSDLEPLMLFNDHRFELAYLIAKGTTEEKWAGQFLPPKNIILYSLKNIRSFEKSGFTEILTRSSIGEVIKKNKIKYLWLTVDNEDRARIKQWTTAHKIKVIGSDFTQQKNFEDKIWFDDFLAQNNLPKPASQIYRPAKDKIEITGKIVLQAVRSAGSEGTFFAADKKSVKKLLAKKIIARNGRYLVRQFAAGRSCGITILVTPKIVALSAVRQQCFAAETAFGRPDFKGIQWLTYDQVKKSEKNINQTFSRFGRILHQQKFFGYANVDFIIAGKNEIKIIECNPRFSTSTAQLARFPQLISGIKAGNLLISEFLKQNQYQPNPKFYPLPRTNFTGCVLDVDIEPKKSLTIKKIPAIGLYRKLRDDIKFISADIRKIKQPTDFIFLTFVASGEKYTEKSTLGLIVCNYRLFDGNGRINKEGKNLLAKFNFA